MSERARIHVYTGDGKGKTTAALGLLLRFLGGGGQACLVQFDKGAEPGSDFYGERRILERLEGMSLQPTGLPRFNAEKGTFRFKNVPGDFDEARRGLQVAKAAMQAGHGLLVLDEVLSLVLTELVKKEDIEALLNRYEELGRPCELVLTGHKIWPELVAKVDLVTEMKKQKHYFDEKQKARKGIEY
jgi:cob(I)alamin adenosyltransferase